MGRDALIAQLNDLRADNKVPRVHPNGFIQVDINKAQRLHCWSPLNPYRQKTYHPIHNHIFNFVSEVIVGRLINVDYGVAFPPEDFDQIGTFHDAWEVKVIEGEETQLIKQDGPPMIVVPCNMACIQRGQKYEVQKFEFHESLAPVPAITIMTKYGLGPDDMKAGPNSQGATVLVPCGVTPDNDFLRSEVDTDLLWEIIYETAST